MDQREDLKAIPSVDVIVREIEESGAGGELPKRLLTRAVRAAVERERQAILARGDAPGRSPEETRAQVLEAARDEVRRAATKLLIPVVNATGIIVHTNLGRAPLSPAAIATIAEIASGYTNLEYDLFSGERGNRDLLVRDALCELSGAEDALIVNNNAAAVLLALDTIARGREVVVSRGELIEIGGAFRLPEVFERSGATMVAVGTTNRTRISDFERGIRGRTGAILTAHWSNYEIVGFVERVDLPALVALGQRTGIPVIHDLGSGILFDPAALGLPGEMTLAESVTAGSSIATVSGDKLLGGSQAGIAVGQRGLIGRMRANPLMRALRPGKLTLAALQATLLSYLEGDAARSVPVLRLLATPVTALETRANAMAAELGSACRRSASVRVIELSAEVGGGAAPERGIESRGLEISPRGLSVETVVGRMLLASPPVVARIRESKVIVDLRAVAPAEDRHVVSAVVGALREG
jgi:L-seryl-tRNA(Ser) seleniumtransferase